MLVQNRPTPIINRDDTEDNGSWNVGAPLGRAMRCAGEAQARNSPPRMRPEMARAGAFEHPWRDGVENNPRDINGLALIATS